jgi:hypothetical protein
MLDICLIPFITFGYIFSLCINKNKDIKEEPPGGDYDDDNS